MKKSPRKPLAPPDPRLEELINNLAKNNRAMMEAIEAVIEILPEPLRRTSAARKLMNLHRALNKHNPPGSG